jgi:predicted site-specific integrase-resolvase
MSKSPEYITPETAAGIIDIEVSGVRRYCRIGRLRAMKLARDWLILREDAERFKGIERKVGRPCSNGTAKA